MNKINNNPVGSFKVSVPFSIARLFSFSHQSHLQPKISGLPVMSQFSRALPQKEGLREHEHATAMEALHLGYPVAEYSGSLVMKI